MAKITKKPDNTTESVVAETVSKPESFVYMRKKTMREYELVSMTVDGDKVISQIVLKSDIPGIIVGHYLKHVRLSHDR